MLQAGLWAGPRPVRRDKVDVARRKSLPPQLRFSISALTVKFACERKKAGEHKVRSATVTCAKAPSRAFFLGQNLNPSTSLLKATHMSPRPTLATQNPDPATHAATDLMSGAEIVTEQKATYAIIVDNEAGVLHRVVGLFAARGYNIESLTVAETDRAAHTSRITVVTRGSSQALAQIRAQLEKMVCTRKVIDVGADEATLERELALVKVAGTGSARMEALRLSEIFRARVVDTTHESFVFEVSGASSKIDKFEALMKPLGLVEIARTGVLSFGRGAERG
eukprot:gene17455-17646_t